MLSASPLHALNSVYETEPNDTPPDFNEVSGSVILIGEMDSGDQDGFRWTVSDVDAQQSWTLSFQGVAGPGAREAGETPVRPRHCMR